MAVGPSDIKLTDDEVQKVSDLVERIDPLLRGSHPRDDDIQVHVGPLDPRVRQEVEWIYEDAGWTSVMMKGEYLVFSKT